MSDYDARHPLQYIGTHPPVKRMWRDNGGLFFETGEFILLTDKGWAIVKNAIWQVSEEPPAISQAIEGDTVNITATMKAPRLISMEFKDEQS